MKPKACLIYPPLPASEKESPFSVGFGKAVPLGICYLAAVLRNQMGWDVAIIDCRNYDKNNKELSGIIAGTQADIYGFSSSTGSAEDTFDIASRLKETTGKKIVLGGPHVTALPAETLERCNGIDVGVIGEGEETVKELFPAVIANTNPASIQGIVFRESERIVVNSPREFIEDLDGLPFPAWDLLMDIARYYRPSLFSYRSLPSTHLVTSRGCPFKCFFCDRSVFGNRYRQFSPDYIVQMIVYLQERYGIRDFLFDDDTFIISKRRVTQFCNQLGKLPFRIAWACNATVNRVDHETLELMAASGCWQIAYGVESGSQKMLDRMQKQATTQQISQALRLTYESGIRTKAFFMVGFPGETRETVEESIDFVLNNPIHDLQCSIFAPFPNTAAADLIHEPIDWTQTNMLRTHYGTEGLSAEEINAFHKKILFRFYLRPSVMINRLKDCLDGAMIKKYLWASLLFFRVFIKRN